MGFRKGNYASVWEVTPVGENRTKVRISTSRKNKQTDQYEQDFSGFVMFVGTATASKAARLQKRDRIVLGDIEVTTRYDQERGKEYVNYTCFDFEPAEHREFSQPANEPGNNEPEQQREDDGLPF